MTDNEKVKRINKLLSYDYDIAYVAGRTIAETHEMIDNMSEDEIKAYIVLLENFVGDVLAVVRGLDEVD